MQASFILLTKLPLNDNMSMKESIHSEEHMNSA